MRPPARKRQARPSRTPVVAVVLLAVAAAVVAAVVHFTTARPAPQTSTATLAPAEPGGKSRGRSDAPVVLEVFSDFLCIHCANFATGTERALIAEFVEPGVVRMVYRQFPVISQLSVSIAEASECAADQKRFWAFHDAVYARVERGAMRREADIDSAAREARLDLAALTACRRGGRMRSRVEADYNDGASRGVQATPTFFINGRRVVGNQPLDVFRAEINAARKR
jgi:protein-disulfide isomerase